MDHFSSINRKKSLITIAVLITLLTAYSCKDQDVMFREYVVEGGISYLGSVSGLKARIGYNRLEVTFSVVDVTTTKVGIYWNDYQDSTMIDIGSTKAIKQIIDLPEGQYSLFVKSFDEYGNASNPAELVTRTVGDNYLAALAHRGFKSKSTRFENDLLIEWQNADPINGARFTELFYTNTNGIEKRLRVENETTTTSITDYKQGTTFKRITYYSPDDQWLDTLIPPVVTETVLMIDKKLGNVVDFSNEYNIYVANNFYNGNTADMWITNDEYPEYITIDLGLEIPVSGFGIWPAYQLTNGRSDPRAPTLIRFECSLNNIDWVTAGEFDYNNSIHYYQRLFDIPVTNARFVRFTGVECTQCPVYSPGLGGPGNNVMNFAELDVFFHLENE